MSEWIDVNDKLPKYGQEVEIKVDCVLKTGLYVRDGSDFSSDWFEKAIDPDHESSVLINYITKIEWRQALTENSNPA